MRSLGATAGLLAATAALFVFGGCSDDASAQAQLRAEFDIVLPESRS